MKALQTPSEFLSDYTSVVVIAIAVVTFFVPTMMGWVNNALFVDPVSNKFTCQSIIIGVIMFSMGLTLTTEDFKILAQRPFDICIGAIAQYLIMPFLAFALTKAFIPQMKERGWGRIIFQASMTSYIGQPQVCGYSTAKAGYLGLIHTLTAEVAEYGITVNAIAPGWIDTPMFHKAVDNDPPRLAKILGRIPAKSVGDPMDVGMCAAFLCSDAARYISGTCIPVDGGALIGF